MLAFLSKLIAPSKAAAPAPPPASPEEYSPAVVDAMAAEMSDRQGVWWACKSCRMVEGQLSASDVQAVEAAETWVKQPSEEAQGAATEAALASEFKGPGAWAAQAAAWAAPGAQVAGMGAALAGAGSVASAATTMAPYAVAGAVKLAAARAAEVPDVPDAPPALKAPAPEVRELPNVEMPGAPPAPQPADPAEQQAAAKALKPFIDLGHEIAEVEQPWSK